VGKAEFMPTVRVGDFVYYYVAGNIGSDRRRVMCQVTSLKSAPFKGIHGSFKILDIDGGMPKTYAELYMLLTPLDTGYLEIGKSTRGRTVKLMVNPFFIHVLIAGMTSMGKTHLQTVLQEEFLKQRIPSLVIDSQGELIHLNEFSPDAIVAEELKFDDLLGYIKQRKTVVYNLQGLPYQVKAKRAYEVLSQLMSAKEQDYKYAENDVKALEILPVLVDVDEAEIYAPDYLKGTGDPQCKATLIDIAKRGSKYGIGLILATQRPPQLELELRSQCNSAVVFHVYDDGSRKVLRMLPYISTLELNRVKNFDRGQCLIVGQLVAHPIMVNVRDIQTRRAKNVNFEEILGLEKLVQPEEASSPGETILPGKAEIQVMNKGASVDVSALCPDCKKPLTYKNGKWVCTNEDCRVIEVRAGKVVRSAI